jgi:ATP-GRASP peptide maturase of grasp-with-spasm system
MILFLSSDSFEQGTDPIIDWLIYYKADFVKLTVSDIYNENADVKFDSKKKLFIYKGLDITQHVNVVCYRRFLREVQFVDTNSRFVDQLNRELNDELKDLTGFMFHLLKDKVWFPSPELISVNKLNVLSIAEENGLRVPWSQVLTQKDDLREFQSFCPGGLITKPIKHSSYFISGDQTYFMYVKTITDEFIEAIPECFPPTLFQEKIKGSYEIRTFYLDGDFYSSAVLVEVEDREIDIKQSFDTSLAHWVPYTLPPSVEEKLDRTMKAIGLNTGSIDLIKTGEGDFIFLEVNPVGQYGASSFRCNYSLEKRIAEWLIKKDSYERQKHIAHGDAVPMPCFE